VDDLCHEVECSGAHVCDPQTGECVADDCFGVTCDAGQVCYEGDCIDDPCASADCPDYYDCVVVDSGDATPSAQCQLDQSYWDPGTEGSEVLATGEGGCGCRTGVGASSAAKVPLFMLLLLLLFGATRSRALLRRRSARKGGQR
jgi:hypothetical protein